MKQLKDVRSFAGGSMNLDVAESFLKPNEFRELYNCRLIVSDDNKVGYIENVKGNTLVSTTLPSGTNRTVGSCVDEENQAIYYFVYSSQSAHCIFRYNILNGSIDKILYEESILGLSKDVYIQCNVLGGMLFWTDNESPKMIDIEKAYNYTNGGGSSSLDRYTSIDEQVISVLKYPHISQPTALYYSDFTYEQNNLRGKLFQFRIRYTYDNNEESVLSDISGLPKPDYEAFVNEGYYEDQHFNNRIDVSFNSGSSEVYKIDIIAREGNIGHWRVIKTFDKYESNGNLRRDSDNDLFTPNTSMVYWFYNNVIGKVLDQDDAGRDYDYVPIKAGAQEIIEKNRLIYGDITEGFDNVDIDVDMYCHKSRIDYRGDIDIGYTSTDLGLGAGIKWIKFQVPSTIIENRIYGISLLYDNTTTIPENPNGEITVYHRAISSDTQSSVAQSLLDKLNLLIPSLFYFPDPNDSFATYNANGQTGTSAGVFYAMSNAIPFFWASPLTTDGFFKIMASEYSFNTFKAGAWHEFGLRYYDEQGRGGNINTSEECNVYVPNYTQSNELTRVDHKNLINWTINHDPPSWAKYYRWCYTKNTSMVDSKYIPLDETCFTDNGTYWSIEINKILGSDIDDNPIDKRTYYGDWEQGDKIRFVARYDGVSAYAWLTYTDLIEYEILNYDLDDTVDPNVFTIKLNKFNLTEIVDDINNFNVLVEVYRPRKELPDDENDRVFYEVGQKYDINNGAHSVLSGVIDSGDAYLRKISSSTMGVSYPIESLSFSNYYDSEYCDIGRPVVVDKNANRKRYKSDLRFGGKYIQSTQINDICKFLVEDYETLSDKFGAITVLKERGFTLKVLQEYKVNSIYLNRSELQQALHEGVTVVTGVTEVLGSISVSNNRWGCQNPESAFVVNNNLYYADINNRTIIRDALNGSTPITEYGVKDYVRDVFDNLSNYTPFVAGYYDGKHEEVIFTIANSVNGLLYHAATLVFKESPHDKWTGFRSHKRSIWSGENFIYSGQNLISFESGKLYTHNTNSLRNNFYGVQYDQEINFVSNINPESDKVFSNVIYASNKEWEDTNESDGKIIEISIAPSDNYPTGMYSILTNGNFTQNESKREAAILRDMYTNTDHSSPSPVFKDLFTGRQMRGEVLRVKMKNNLTDEVILRFIDIRSRISL